MVGKIRKYLTKTIAAPLTVAASLWAGSPAQAQDADFLPDEKEDTVDTLELPDLRKIIGDETYFLKAYAKLGGVYGENLEAITGTASVIVPVKHGFRLQGGYQHIDQTTDVFTEQRTRVNRGWGGLGWVNKDPLHRLFLEAGVVGDRLRFDETAEGDARRFGGYARAVYDNKKIGFGMQVAGGGTTGSYDLEFSNNEAEGKLDRLFGALKLHQKIWGPKSSPESGLDWAFSDFFGGDALVSDYFSKLDRGLYFVTRGSADHQRYRKEDLVNGYILGGEAGFKWQDKNWFAEAVGTLRQEDFKYPQTDSRSTEVYPGVAVRGGWAFTPYTAIEAQVGYDDKFGWMGGAYFKLKFGVRKKQPAFRPRSNLP